MDHRSIQTLVSIGVTDFTAAENKVYDLDSIVGNNNDNNNDNNDDMN